MLCLNCKKELEQVEGKKARRFCDDKCRMAFKRNSNPNISNPNTEKIKSEQVPDLNSPDYLTWLEKTPLSKLEKLKVFIPNWKRSGSKTKLAAQIELFKLIKSTKSDFLFLGQS